MISFGRKPWFVAIWRGGVTWRLNEMLVICFRTPLARPMFSERNGYVQHVFKLFGWRLWVINK